MNEPLKNQRHEAFARHYAEHGNASAAWVHATGGKRTHADGNASRWTKNASIVARVAWLKTEAERVAQEMAAEEIRPTVMAMAEKRLILAEIARGGKDNDRIAAIKADNDLAGEGAEAGSQSALVSLMERIAGND